jgi:hypothetical protein
MTKKSIDAVEVQHRGNEAVRRETQGMTQDEILAYWQRQADLLRQEIKAARTKRKAS